MCPNSLRVAKAYERFDLGNILSVHLMASNRTWITMCHWTSHSYRLESMVPERYDLVSAISVHPLDISITIHQYQYQQSKKRNRLVPNGQAITVTATKITRVKA